jgi:GntR family transcriptional regulator
MPIPPEPKLTLRLDFDIAQPAYLQIVDELSRLAARGRVRKGQRLPTVRGLANQLGLNFNTVARAYRVLQRRGLISAQRGRGSFLTCSVPPSAAARRRALKELTRQYVEDAQGHMFSHQEIAAALRRQLASTRRSR